MTRQFLPLSLLLALAACGDLATSPAATPAAPPPAEEAAANDDAATEESVDAAAQAAPADPASDAQGGQSLGTTVASLGSPAEPGLWLKTPLVRSEQSGRVTHRGTGKSVAVTLIPIDGPATAGSRMSLQAMQQLGVSLTDLAEVEVTLAG